MKWAGQLGANLQTKDGLQETDTKLADKKVIGIYFSAYWCGPCRRFTPVLSAVYDEMIEEHPDFEVIFVSLDRNPAQFTEYFGQMPFLALPYEEHEIKRSMTTKSGLVTIPMLVFVDGEGNLITKDGRNIVANSGGDVRSIWEQLRK
ncbi:Nucleoredoxin [Phytophthora megakarya]|uniref:protein-disulfide reductase n=1 Tax=Phytophthora megakarya TaxID=4795 RepID=A0A225W073_9STRA|nr:Nucleoredoxin [Phytophthora megakarya]